MGEPQVNYLMGKKSDETKPLRPTEKGKGGGEKGEEMPHSHYK